MPRPVAVLFALDVEGSGIVDALEDRSERVLAERRVVEGRLGATPVVAVRTGVGKVASATSALLAIERCGAGEVVVIGTAGALAPGLRVGDLVLATRVVQHDLGVREGRRAETSGELRAEIAASLRSAAAPRLHEGTILTGDRACFTWRRRLRLRWQFRRESPLAVEMEGAAAGVACASLAVPFAVLRVASDHAGPLALFEIRKNLERVAPVPGKHIAEWLRHRPVKGR